MVLFKIQNLQCGVGCIVYVQLKRRAFVEFHNQAIKLTGSKSPCIFLHDGRVTSKCETFLLYRSSLSPYSLASSLSSGTAANYYGEQTFSAIIICKKNSINRRDRWASFCQRFLNDQAPVSVPGSVKKVQKFNKIETHFVYYFGNTE